MKWQLWKPSYLDIAGSLGFSEESEEAARLRGSSAASSLPCVLSGSDALNAISDAVRGRCLVTGNAPSLEAELRRIMEMPSFGRLSIVASDSSCETLRTLSLLPDVIVTDADGNLEVEREMNAAGSLLVLHFHGDNIERAAAFAGELQGRVVVTTQAGPAPGTFNFGGFTDGDRAVLMCEEFGSTEIMLAGFDFNDVAERGREGELKRRKLEFAREIIREAVRRGAPVVYTKGMEDREAGNTRLP